MQLSIALAVWSLAIAVQQPPDNGGWLAFADSLGRSTDTRQLTRAADAIRRQRDFRSRIRAGLLYHRVYEINRKQDAFDRAAGLLKDGLRHAPRIPAIHYLAGRALVSGPHITERGGIITLKIARNVIGQSERERGMAALEFALQLDPLFIPAALELTRSAIENRSRDELAVARSALRPIVARTDDTNARVLLAEVERRLGDPGAAASALETHRSTAPAADSTAGRVEYERALALMLVNERAQEGVKAYWRGTVGMTAALAQAYFADLAYVADSNGVLSWTNAPLAEKADWLRRFWSYQAAKSGVSVADRILTHYQRLAYARDHFPRRPTVAGRGISRSPSQGRSGREILDDKDGYRRDIEDRGLIWVKYGKPDHRVTGGGLDYEAWIYELDRKNINFFFTTPAPGAPPGEDGYSLFSGVTGCSGSAGDFLMQVARFEPELQKLYTGACRNPTPSALAFEVARSNLSERAYENVRRNNARPRFDRDVPFYYALYTLAGPREASTVVAAVAIPAERLSHDAAAGEYALRASLIITDTLTGTVTRADTALRLRSARPLGSHEYVRAYLQLTADPSATTVYRVAVIDDKARSAGRIYGGERAVESFAGGLSLSDLILADTAAGGGWRRGNAALDLVPMEEFPGGAFNLYYEIYHAAPGSYRTEVVIEPTDGATRRLLSRVLGPERSRIELSFGGSNPQRREMLQELRRVGTELPAGRYRITVRVTDSTGRQADRSRLLRVSSREPGGNSR